jgi:hypothetical protein
MATPRSWQRKVAERHLLSIARLNGLKIRWLSGRHWHTEAEAQGTAQRVLIPKPNNQLQYLVALHEFGHLLGPFPIVARPGLPLVNATDIGASPGQYALLMEAAAWGWAIEHIANELEFCFTPKHIEKAAGEPLAAYVWGVYTAHDDEG